MNEEQRELTEEATRAAGRSNPPKPAPGLARIRDLRRKMGGWAITYGTRRKARRANSVKASRKEMRFYQRHTRREGRQEARVEGLVQTFLNRESEKERKRRIRRNLRGERSGKATR